MGLAAAIVGQGDALDTGAKPPEKLLNPDQFIAELRAQNIDIREEEIALA